MAKRKIQCAVCGKEIIAKTRNKKYCNACAKEVLKQQKKPSRPKPPQKSCAVCGEMFQPRTKRSILCPKEECRRIHKRQIDKKSYRSRNAKQSQIRPYSYDSDLLITQYIDQGHAVVQIAKDLDRDIDDLKKHIEEMHEKGTIDRMRNIMQAHRIA
jgi:hypothetical protein